MQYRSLVNDTSIDKNILPQSINYYIDKISMLPSKPRSLLRLIRFKQLDIMRHDLFPLNTYIFIVLILIQAYPFYHKRNLNRLFLN